MIRCSDLAGILAAYADGVADERGRRIVERHVQLCATCYNDLIAARRVVQQLRRVALLPPGVAARVPQHHRAITARLAARRRAYRRRRLVLALVIGCLVLQAVMLWLVIWLG